MKIAKLTVFLALVAALAAAALSYVYNLTSPVISAAEAEAEQEQLAELYSNGETFEVLDTNLTNYKEIESVYGVQKDSETVGYVYKLSVTGYGGDIVYLVSIDTTGTYQGYAALDVSNETKGFGSRVGTDEMTNNVVGKTVNDEVDTLSGATISSSAVVEGLDEAAAHYEANFANGGDAS